MTTTVREFHERAMNAADAMIEARRRGAVRDTAKHAAEAFNAECAAATLAFDKAVSIQTRIILLRSVANLAREARLWEPAIDLAVRALADPVLADHRAEVFRIVDTLRTYEHLGLQGLKLTDADVQLSIAGPEAAPGFAPAEEVTKRISWFEKLMLRGAMNRAGVPYVADPPRSAGFRGLYRPFISEGRAASYALTLRFGLDEQTAIDFPDLPEGPAGKKRKPPAVSKVLDDLIASAKAYAAGGPAALRRVIKDESYRKNTATLLRHLSPDNQRITTVGFTILRNGQEVPVALPDRDAYDARSAKSLMEETASEALPGREKTIVGQLLAANHTNAEDPRGTIVRDNETRVIVHYDEAEHGDIVEEYWRKRVRARVRLQGSERWCLLDIESARPGE